MKLKIEAMEWMIWLLFIIPLFVLIFYIWGIEKGLLSLILVPIVLIVKNTFLEKHYAWKPAYSVGVAKLDEEHKKLFALMMEMYTALNKTRGSEEAKRILEELKDYTLTHFKREEDLMKKHNFPDYESHLAQHEAIKVKINEFQEQFDSNSTEVSKNLLRYLQDWLVNHIQGTDKQYSEFLVSRGEH
ncbi:MAG: bacteriohemerythrin [Gammaproteobacteria bacterium]|nr:bacteriohemerythrin [Gammaproteobacteria bacterium]MDH5593236.1 bacteriohemerythrin [Gammaproteobacteria bacterium]MDH5614894.1 bacteriohemerythrin [Gammaproteobacteria bacterium]